MFGSRFNESVSCWLETRSKQFLNESFTPVHPIHWYKDSNQKIESYKNQNCYKLFNQTHTFHKWPNPQTAAAPNKTQYTSANVLKLITQPNTTKKKQKAHWHFITHEKATERQRNIITSHPDRRRRCYKSSSSHPSTPGLYFLVFHGVSELS